MFRELHVDGGTIVRAWPVKRSKIQRQLDKQWKLLKEYLDEYAEIYTLFAKQLEEQGIEVYKNEMINCSFESLQEENMLFDALVENFGLKFTLLSGHLLLWEFENRYNTGERSAELFNAIFDLMLTFYRNVNELIKNED